MDEWMNELIGKRVLTRVLNDKLNNRRGVITSVDLKLALPIHVTLVGEDYETDFRFQELEVLD